MHRVCFTLQVRPDRLEEYRRRHAAVWPEMLAALHEAGWRDYSLFLRDDGLLVGYFLTEDLAAAQAAMAATDVNRRWQAEMAEFFTDGGGGDPNGGGSDGGDPNGGDPNGGDPNWRPDTGMTVLEEVFNLEEQLERAR